MIFTRTRTRDFTVNAMVDAEDLARIIDPLVIQTER
jgi:tRNA nucleotidyltransferase/poly(A) polymerase